ncbi:MAG TPA: NUDIX domain-containing protein [Solirubrobacteraceae bacterium]|nr:NUDIX domain-containing protein [Solirubrobacteraceae bacterium]
MFIAHMGGPFWRRKDEGAWSIVKGEYEDPEDPYAAARREFEEETGLPAPEGRALPLGEAVQGSGKRVCAWAIESDLDPRAVRSNEFTLEWPKGSGQIQRFPEIDRAGWFDLATAERKLVKGQLQLLRELERLRASREGS